MAGKTGLYVLRHTHDPSEMLPGKIETYPWGCAYRPETVFRAGWTENGIRVLMECERRSPAPGKAAQRKRLVRFLHGILRRARRNGGRRLFQL